MSYVFTHRLYETRERYVACEVISGEIPPGHLTTDWSRVDCPRCRHRAPAAPGSLLARVPAEFMALAVALANRISAQEGCPRDVLDMVEDIRLAAAGFGPRNDWQQSSEAAPAPGNEALTRLWYAFTSLPGGSDVPIVLYTDGSGSLGGSDSGDVVVRWDTLAEGAAALRAT